MEIKSISTFEYGIGVFHSVAGLVETTDGQQYKYMFEYSNSWSDMDDYFDNVRSDFENECNSEDFGLNWDSLFVRKDIWDKDEV